MTGGERQADVQKLLDRHAQREHVKAVVIDLWQPSRRAIHMTLPEAAIVVDKFHVVAQVHQAMQEVRGGRRLRGDQAWLMRRNVERVTLPDAERLRDALRAQDALRRAWLLKEELRAVYRVARKSRRLKLSPHG